MYDLEMVITDRRSIRMFRPDQPVPRDLVDQALEQTVRAPSNSNIQPWHLELVSGPALQRLVDALLHEARSKPPDPHPCQAYADTREPRAASTTPTRAPASPFPPPVPDSR